MAMDDYFSDDDRVNDDASAPDTCKTCPYNDAANDVCTYPQLGCYQWTYAAEQARHYDRKED